MNIKEKKEHFNKLIEQYNIKKSLRKFLNTSSGVNHDEINWFIKEYECDYPEEVSDLKLLCKLLDAKEVTYSMAKESVKRLKNYGLTIYLNEFWKHKCINCGLEEQEYNLSILLKQGKNREEYGKNHNITVFKTPRKLLTDNKLRVKKDCLDEYLKSICTEVSEGSIKEIDRLINKLNEVKKVIKKEYLVDSWTAQNFMICSKCLEEPDYEKIVMGLRIDFLKPEWLEILLKKT